MKATTFDAAAARERLPGLVEQVLEQAKRRGATEAEALAGCDHGFSVTVRMGEVETLEHENDRSLSATVYFGKCKGSAASSDLSERAVSEIVEAACDIAKHTSADDCAGLAAPGAMAADVPDLDLDHPWDLDLADAIELATECEDAARAVPEIVNSEGAGVDTSRSVRCYGNTHGFVGACTGTHHSSHCLIVAGRNGEMQRDSWYSVNRHPARLEAVARVGERAAVRAVGRLGARKLASCKAPVLFAPETARTLLGHFIGAISGGALYRGTSFLPDSLGRRIFPESVRMDEEPRLQGGLGSASFDMEGVGTCNHPIVVGGAIESYVLNSYSARRLGLQTTGNAGGVRNLVLHGGAHDFDSLVKEMGTGLVVTELIGMGVNPVTGDYSQGAVGAWVENGESVYPVEEITIADNLRAMFANIVQTGSDLDERGNIRCGSILISEMTIAGA